MQLNVDRFKETNEPGSVQICGNYNNDEMLAERSPNGKNAFVFFFFLYYYFISALLSLCNL